MRNGEQPNEIPQTNQVSEISEYGVLYALYRGHALVKALGWEDVTFPAQVFTDGMLHDPNIIAAKRLQWEASLRATHNSNQLVLFGLRQEVKSTAFDKSPFAGLARKVLKHYENNENAYKEWMN